MQLALYAVPDDAAEPVVDSSSGALEAAALYGSAEHTCTLNVGGDSAAEHCVMQIPRMGRFLLVGETRDALGTRVQAAVLLGKTHEAWLLDPLRDFTELTVVPDRATYAFGDQVTFNFLNPCSSAQLMVRYGNRLAQDERFVALDARGPVTVSVPVTERVCRGGCDARVLLACPRGTHAAPADLPVSKLFDLAMPHAVAMRASIDVPDKSRTLQELTVEPSAERAAPGQEIEVAVHVGAEQRNSAHDSLDVHLFVVDEKILDLRQAPMVAVAERFEPELRDGGLNTRSNVDDLALTGAYVRSRDTWQRRFGMKMFKIKIFISFWIIASIFLRLQQQR